MKTLKKVGVNRYDKYVELILRFGIDRFQAVRLDDGLSPDETAKRLRKLADNIERDTVINDDKHEWKCISPGMYDDLYECQKCKLRHMTSVDDPDSELPKEGCEDK